MDLQEVRGRINQLDETLGELFGERLECSVKVAAVKMATHDEVYKPKREKEIYARYPDDLSGDMQKAFFREIVQLSRKHQYRQFIAQGIIDEGFFEWIESGQVFEKGGVIKLALFLGDGECTLDLNNILQIAADTSLKLLEVKTSLENNSVDLVIDVPNEDNAKEEAFSLAYMLYKETGRNEDD